MGRCLHCEPAWERSASCCSAWKLPQSPRIGVRAAGCDETGEMKLIMTFQSC